MIEIFYDTRCVKSILLMDALDQKGIPYKAYDNDTLEGSMEASYRNILFDYTPVVYVDGERLESTNPIILADEIEERMEKA